MERPSWAPVGIDINRPSIARVYDCSLGGFHNFTADRQLVETMREMMPEALLMARANRAFLTRAVRFCLKSGVRQFLDIGSGIPTSGNVHEVARRIDPGSRVVYVDSDPVAVAHSQAILGDDDKAAIIEADVREPKLILEHPAVHRLIDFDQPLGLMMVAVLHFVADEEDPRGLIDQFAKRMVAGGYLVMSHGTADGPTGSQMTKVTDLYRKTVADNTMRSRAEVQALFGGFDLLSPGVVWPEEWVQPGGDDEVPIRAEPLCGYYAGVGRKP
jgi:S-adenosyl methyltransferase